VQDLTGHLNRAGNPPRLPEIPALSAASHFTALCLFGCWPKLGFYRTSASTRGLSRREVVEGTDGRWHLPLFGYQHAGLSLTGRKHVYPPPASPPSGAASRPCRQAICRHFL